MKRDREAIYKKCDGHCAYWASMRDWEKMQKFCEGFCFLWFAKEQILAAINQLKNKEG